MALTLLGEYSGEYLPQAMAPWIIIPLAAIGTRAGPAGGPRADATGASADGAARASPMRAAARSAVAIALCSGVNAACTAAALVPALIYILTRPAVLRWRLLAWWALAVVLATLWWSVPLALLAKYGVSFLPYTESAAATTSVTGLDNALRGTENWISYLVVDGQPWWQVGYRIANQVLPILLSGLVAGLGLAGLARRRLPERRFLLWTLLAGLVIISAGHPSLGNPLVGPVAAVINGPAAAFRNLWKFDPLIRLPVALGIAHLLATVHARRRQVMVIAAAVAGIGGLALPVYASGLANAGSFTQIPAYWTATADWLNAHAGHQAVLLVPGATFGQYDWGSPLDEVLQPLTSVDWAERNLSDVSSAGNERILDAIDQQLAAGDGSAGLTQVMARMGVRYVVVRNDLNPSVLQGALPARVSQAIASSPGMTEVATFGPDVGSATPDDATNLDPPYPAVQIYQFSGAEPVAAVQPVAGTLRVYGAPESMLTLADEGLLAGRPVLLDGDGAGLPAAGTVATDSLRRRARDFGELRTSYSPTLTATQPASTFEAAQDYLEPDWSQYLTVARYTGITDVTASSSASDIGTIPSLWASGLQPYAAIDGDLQTRWESGDWTGPVGQWIQVNFGAPIQFGAAAGGAQAGGVQRIRVTFVDNGAIGPPVSRVVVTTAAGQVTDSVRATGTAQWLPVPAGRSGWLRITVAGLAWPPATALGAEVSISDILVPGVTASRTIVAPAVPGGDPSLVVLAKAQPQPAGCVLGSLGWACDPDLAAPTEEQYGFDHSFYEATPRRATLTGSAVLIDPSLADHYARLGAHAATVTGSSAYTGDPQDQALSAFDGNPATTWITSDQDTRPTLTIRWGSPRVIGHITIERPPGTAGLLPVLIAGSGGQARGALLNGASGTVSFRPMRTTSLTLTFTQVQAPLRITDVAIPGVPFRTTSGLPFRLGCGLGPRLTVNGVAVATRVSGTFAALLTGQPLTYTACSPVTLAAGLNEVTEPATDAFSLQDAVLGGPAPVPSSRPATPAVIQSWTPSARTVTVAAAVPSYLVISEDFNAGWRAVIGGRQLQAVRLDGWKQAWLLPAGTRGVVTLTYGPDQVYVAAVAAGLACLLLVMLAAVWTASSRRPGSPRLRRRPGRGPDGAPPGPVRPPATPKADARAGGALAAGIPMRGRLTSGTLTGGALTGVAGLWLAGLPGLVILPGATLLILAAARRGRRRGRGQGGQQAPWLLAGLALAASAVAAVGQHILLEGDTGLVVTALDSAIPQLVCVLIVACLIALLYGTNTPGSPGRALAAVGQAWRTLSQDDPLWAICVSAQARGGRWDVAEFYATGVAEVEATLARARQLGLPARGARALDFGCGVGRLTRPLADRFDQVTGVDIAPQMLALARQDNPVADRCEFVLNDRPDLALLPDGRFDLVYSSVVLQHLPAALIGTYLAELARVLRPGGVLIVQLPTRPRWTPRGLAYRCLPPALLGVIQRRLLSYPAPMRMHGLPERRVRRLLAACGVQVLAADPVAYHPDWRERRYYGRRLGPPPPGGWPPPPGGWPPPPGETGR